MGAECVARAPSIVLPLESLSYNADGLPENVFVAVSAALKHRQPFRDASLVGYQPNHALRRG